MCFFNVGHRAKTFPIFIPMDKMGLFFDR
jgi:hypothetical protein